MNSNIIVAEVYYTVTDETSYVLKSFDDKLANGIETMDDMYLRLMNDEWTRCGNVVRWDNVVVEMWSKGNRYIAIWDSNKQPIVIK